MPHLWEVKHAYYCENSNYFCSPYRHPDWGHGFTQFEDWESFIAEWGPADFDHNLLFRWDWHEEGSENDCEVMQSDMLYCYWMGQRKGIYQITAVKVTKDLEPAVIEFLKPRMNYLFKLWKPLYTGRDEEDTLAKIEEREPRPGYAG